jgi:hypothetical protein
MLDGGKIKMEGGACGIFHEVVVISGHFNEWSGVFT